MTFTATGDSSVKLIKKGSQADISLEYSFDGFKTDPIPYTIGTEIKLTDGQSVSMRAVSTNDTISSSYSNWYKFVMSGGIAASGNIQSLLDKTCQRMNVPEMCYTCMFQNCSALTTAPELPATTLADACYESMFISCSSLTTAPKLPATTLADACYESMFSSSGISEFTVDMTACTSVPSLPYSDLFTDSGVSNYTVLVPSSLYDTWITAASWSEIASNIQAV